MSLTALRAGLLSLVVFGTASSAISHFTYGRFSQERGVTAQTLTAGTVALEDNDSGSTLVSMEGAKPGAQAFGCIKVIYSGTLDARVRLYARRSGALPPYLDLTVERGRSTGAFPSCNGFNRDDADYGSGPGVLYSGPLSTFPTTFESGIPDPLSPWTAGEERAYRLAVTLGTSEAAQGLTGSATFTWGAENS